MGGVEKGAKSGKNKLMIPPLFWGLTDGDGLSKCPGVRRKQINICVLETTGGIDLDLWEHHFGDGFGDPWENQLWDRKTRFE